MPVLTARPLWRRDAPNPVSALSFRPDIEGLRAIAVLFVLIWHAGVPWLPGGFVGVDVFFVVSGFLMTAILHREMLQTGKINITGFYARRARRLIPASVATLIVTGIATYLILPATRWREIGLDIAAAGGYVVNWRLADRAVDYLAQDGSPSPIQHFWSLSVEEQFYIFWPVILVGLAWIISRVQGSANRWIFALLTAIALISLSYSIHLTTANPGRAYFVSTTRLWELAIGGMAAIAISAIPRIPRAAAAAFCWAGLLGILATGFLLTPDVPFPGSVALIPTVSTVLILLFGPSAGTLGPVRILENRPAQWIGGCSYSMYLWHWPVLVIGGYLITDGLREITVFEGILLVVLSVVPAWLSLRFIENPIRKSNLKDSQKNSMLMAALGIASCLIVGMVVALAGPWPSASAYVSQYVSPSSELIEQKPVGAELLGDTPTTSEAGYVADIVGSISPNPMSAANDNPPVYNGCHQDFASTAAISCVYGDTNSSVTVALVGDSHAAHWVNALQVVAKERGWKLVTYTKSSCPLIGGSIEKDGKPYPECSTWNAEVQKALTGPDRPDIVFVSNREPPQSGSAAIKSTADSLSAAWRPLIASGATLIAIRDTPVSNFNVPDCIASHSDRLSACATPRAEALIDQGRAQEAAARQTGATLIDLNDWICPQATCAPVIGGVIVYRDKTHMTATYSTSLAYALNSAIPLQ